MGILNLRRRQTNRKNWSERIQHESRPRQRGSQSFVPQGFLFQIPFICLRDSLNWNTAFLNRLLRPAFKTDSDSADRGLEHPTKCVLEGVRRKAFLKSRIPFCAHAWIPPDIFSTNLLPDPRISDTASSLARCLCSRPIRGQSCRREDSWKSRLEKRAKEERRQKFS